MSADEPVDLDFVTGLRRDLIAHGDPVRAVAQQAYMKSALPFAGLTKPALGVLLRPHLAAFDFAAPGARERWEATIRALWAEAAVREEWYAALALARHRRAANWRDPASLALWHDLLVAGAWWDVVDEISGHLVADVVRRHRVAATPVMRAWAGDPDLWVRRSAVLCQLGHRDATDRDLLAAAIEANLADRSFWLRKAIGWSLRELARTDPDWVRARVAAWDTRLSGLSRREALKHLG